jgi:ketosteroid isomerase-like protein
MNRVLITAFALSLLASGAQAEAALHGPPDVARSILETEHAFVAKVARDGIAAGFRAYMDPVDGLKFNGGAPVRGAEAIFLAEGGDKPNPAKLSWEPEEIFAAKGGDMAVSWGRFSYTIPSSPPKTFTGRFVTVWRKSDKSEWKGLIDIGTPD